jgi:formamidopyrimidine-DNA glycosylase
MPELPEVETVRRDLDRELSGRKITSATITGARTVRRGTPQALSDALTGKKVKAVKRRGKYLIVVLEDDRWLVVHMRMSGQLLKMAAKDPKPKHTHVVLGLDKGGEIRFVDPRTFGEVFLADPAQLAQDAPDLAELGVDPFEHPITWIEFGRLVRGKRMQLKNLLTDQKVIAGLGNIYSDEILHVAGLRYDRASESLNAQEIRRLHRAMLEVLQDAVAARGSSLADEQYVDLFGKIGGYQSHHQVYARAGQHCHRCWALIEKTKWGGRSTYYCPSCQV